MYELRSCSTSVLLRRNFTLCDHIFHNITTPKISGEMEKMCIDSPYPSNNMSFFVALRVKDENNNTSPVSNLQLVSFVDITTLDLPVYTSETPSAPATTEPIETTKDPVEMYSTSETFSTTVKQITSTEAQSTATTEQIISDDLVGLIVAGSTVVIMLIMLFLSLWMYKVHSQRLKRKKPQPLPEFDRLPTAIRSSFWIPRYKLNYSRTAHSPEYAYRLR